MLPPMGEPLFNPQPFEMIHPSSMFCHLSFRATVGLVPISSCMEGKGMVQPGQVYSQLQADTQTYNHLHTFTPKANLEISINIAIIGSDCERKLEYTLMHMENMQAPCKNTLGQECNPGPSCCKSTGLQTVSPCSLIK